MGAAGAEHGRRRGGGERERTAGLVPRARKQNLQVERHIATTSTRLTLRTNVETRVPVLVLRERLETRAGARADIQRASAGMNQTDTTTPPACGCLFLIPVSSHPYSRQYPVHSSLQAARFLPRVLLPSSSNLNARRLCELRTHAQQCH
eukprot:510191-Rhodomonas_salina.2